MKLLRFRYMLPVSLFIVFDLILIAYAAITWDLDRSDIWHGPNMPDPYKDDEASWTSDGIWDDSYACVIPPKKKPPDGDGQGDGQGDGDGDSPPPPPPPLPPPPVVTTLTDNL